MAYPEICIVLVPSLRKRSPLIGLAYLKAYLRNKGYKAKIIDLNAEYEWPHNDNENIWQNKMFLDNLVSEHHSIFNSITERILEYKTRLIGFSIWSSTKYISLFLSRMIKQKDKDRLIVFGGPECSFSGNELIRNENVDAVIYNEGELTLGELVSLYQAEDKVDFCPGTLLKNGNSIVNCGDREEIKNLDTLPFPDYSDFNLNKYNSPKALSITFYRGCLRRCAFCSTPVIWKKFRSRSAEGIFREMLYQLKIFPGLQKFEIDDTALNLNLDMLSKLCDLIIASGLKINFGGSALIRKEMDAAFLKKLAQAGCNCIGYGLESGSQKIIDSMGKGFAIKEAERVIRDTYNAGIETILGIIVGFPGETEADFRETMNFIEENKGYISSVNSPGECCIGYNSFLHRYPEKFNVVLDPNENGENWNSKDSTNTHKERLRRMQILHEFMNSIKVKTSSYSQASGKY